MDIFSTTKHPSGAGDLQRGRHFRVVTESVEEFGAADSEGQLPQPQTTLFNYQVLGTPSCAFSFEFFETHTLGPERGELGLPNSRNQVELVLSTISVKPRSPPLNGAGMKCLFGSCSKAFIPAFNFLGYCQYCLCSSSQFFSEISLMTSMMIRGTI